MSDALISFPLLGDGFVLDIPRYFTVFGFRLYWYGVIIALGFILGVLYALKVRKRFGLAAACSRSAQREGQHGAARGHLRRGPVILRVRFQQRVLHPFDLGLLFQELGQGQRRGRGVVHPQR